jgi:hypothetical protein
MKQAKKLNNKWIKAAVLGTIWAASEIVLGSFLHNIRFPFSGNILVGIAMILLIAASHIWTEKGIIWRSGLICAILKTMSPSAVIFGPMIAIFMESVLLETAVRLFKNKKIAFMVGAALAMSWNLFHKIINMVLFYGAGIVQLYEKLLKSAQKQLHWDFDIVWVPLLSLLIIYIVLGILAARMGIKTGEYLLDANYKPSFSFENSNANTTFIKPKTNQFDYSISWLIMNTILSIGALVLHNYMPFKYWSFLVVFIIILWSFRYKRALRQVMKPKFWIWFLVITMLTSMLFSKEDGLIIGITMNLRAILLILSFTVLGTELYNPKVKQYFAGAHFDQLSLALELSLASLPEAIANLPNVKTILKEPTAVFYQIIKQADLRLKSNETN